MTTIDFIKITFGMVCATIGFLVAVAKVADDAVHPDIGQRFAAEFRRFTATPSLSRAYVLASLSSDAVFGSRLFSFRSFITSVGVTIGWIFIFLLMSWCVYGHGLWVFNKVFSPFVAKRFWGFAILGIVADFFATVITRAFLLISLPVGAFKKFLVVGLNVLFVVVNFYVLFSVAKWFILGLGFIGIFGSINDWIVNFSNLDITSKLLHDATLIPDGPGQFRIENGDTEVIYAFPEGLFFLSSLLTTIWLWLHLGSALLLKSAINIDAFKKWLVSLSNIDKKPFISAAVIFGSMVALLWILSILVFLIYRIL